MAFPTVLHRKQLASPPLLLAEQDGFICRADESGGWYALAGEILFLPEQSEMRRSIGLTLVSNADLVLAGIEPNLCGAGRAESALLGETFLASDAQTGFAYAIKGKCQPLALGDFDLSCPCHFEGPWWQKSTGRIARLEPDGGQAIEAGIDFPCRLEMCRQLRVSRHAKQ